MYLDDDSTMKQETKEFLVESKYIIIGCVIFACLPLILTLIQKLLELLSDNIKNTQLPSDFGIYLCLFSIIIILLIILFSILEIKR